MPKQPRNKGANFYTFSFCATLAWPPHYLRIWVLTNFCWSVPLKSVVLDQ